jgi:hypothetical protein
MAMEIAKVLSRRFVRKQKKACFTLALDVSITFCLLVLHVGQRFVLASVLLGSATFR